MKYRYITTEYNFNNIKYKTISLVLHNTDFWKSEWVGSINYVLSVINVKYVSYYLKKLEEVMSGEKEKVKIYITDDVNYDAPEDYLTVRKELVTYREEAGGEYVETEELYEFLKVMKAELGLSDEVVVDNRCELDY